MSLPPRLREIVVRWGWGTLADLFFVRLHPERPPAEAIEAVAKGMPSEARWALLGGDESRELALYGASVEGTHRFVLVHRGGRAELLGTGEPALFAWLTSKKVDRLRADPLGLPHSWATPSAPSVESLLRPTFTSDGLAAAEDAIAHALTFVSRHRLGWEALQLLVDPDLAIADRRRQQLVALVLEHTKKNVWKTIRAQPGLAEVIVTLEKSGRFAPQPATTVTSPSGAATASWSKARDHLVLGLTGVTGTWVITATMVGADRIARTNVLVLEASADGVIASSVGTYGPTRAAHVDFAPASAANEHLVRGVNRFFHEDGTVSELDGAGEVARLKSPSPLHREGAPAELHGARLYWPGRVGWWRHGKLHRDDGPALVVPCFGTGRDDAHRGFTAWYADGVLHREDGPAKIYANGDREWWHHGVQREEREGERGE
jgi:hypothetical protein